MQRGVQQYYGGVQKVKGRKKDRGARVGLGFLFWAGLTHESWIGLGGRI